MYTYIHSLYTHSGDIHLDLNQHLGFSSPAWAPSGCRRLPPLQGRSTEKTGSAGKGGRADVVVFLFVD